MYYYSLIIPHHGNAAQLQRLLDSIPQREDMEVITVEDKERRGAGWARNQGLRQARGTYILFADSDDWFLPEIDKVLDEARKSDADIIYFNATAVEETTGKPSRRADRLNWIMRQEDDKREFLLRHTFTEPWCHIIRKSIIDRHQLCFDETPILNDVTFTTQAGYYAERVAVLNSTAYCVCNRKGSTGKLTDDARLIAYTQVMAKTNAFNKLHGIGIYHARMMRPLIKCMLKGKITTAGRCVKEMKQHGYSCSEVIFLLTAYPCQLIIYLYNRLRYSRN